MTTKVYQIGGTYYLALYSKAYALMLTSKVPLARTEIDHMRQS